MACRLFGANQLPKPVLAYFQLDSWEQISVKFESKPYRFHTRKCIWNVVCQNGGHFDEGGLTDRWLACKPFLAQAVLFRKT